MESIPDVLANLLREMEALRSNVILLRHDHKYPIEMRSVATDLVTELDVLGEVTWKMTDQLRKCSIFTITCRPIGVMEYTEKHEIRGASSKSEALCEIRKHRPEEDPMEYEFVGQRYVWDTEPEWLTKITLTNSWGIVK